MITTSLNYVINQIHSLPAVYWTIKENESSRSYIARQEQTISPEESANLLQNAIDNITRGIVHITISERNPEEVSSSKDKFKGFFKFNVNVKPTISQPELTKPQIQPSGVTLQQYIEALNQINELKLENHKLKLELEETENSSKETLTSVITPALIELAKNPAPVIGMIQQMFNKKQSNHDEE